MRPLPLAQPVNHHKTALIKAIEESEEPSYVSSLLARYLNSEAERARQRAEAGDTTVAQPLDGAILATMASINRWGQFVEFLPHCAVFEVEVSGNDLLTIVAGMGGHRFETVVEEMTRRDGGRTKSACDNCARELISLFNSPYWSGPENIKGRADVIQRALSSLDFAAGRDLLSLPEITLSAQFARLHNFKMPAAFAGVEAAEIKRAIEADRKAKMLPDLKNPSRRL